jgi:hypothetical protein
MLKLVGPLNSDFRSAWKFENKTRSGRWGGRGGDADGADMITTDDDLNSEYANAESLFTVADDLWAIVGWAFTCSVNHQRRWKWWKLVLELVLEVLETDWRDRQVTADETGKRDALRESLIIRMLPGVGGSAGYRRVIRAVLANGDEREWKELWKDELSRKRPKKVRMGGRDNTYLGDEDEDENTDEAENVEMEDVEMEDAESDVEEKGIPSEVGEWGGMDALLLRQRFLSLVCVSCP